MSAFCTTLSCNYHSSLADRDDSLNVTNERLIFEYVCWHLLFQSTYIVSLPQLWTIRTDSISATVAYAFADTAPNGLLGGAIVNEQIIWGTKVLGALILPAPKKLSMKKNGQTTRSNMSYFLACRTNVTSTLRWLKRVICYAKLAFP